MKKIFLFAVLIIGVFGFSFAHSRSVFYAELRKMREKNINLQVAQENQKALSDQVWSKKLFWTPSLNFSTGVTRQTVDVPFPEGKDNPYWKLSSSINLFRGGGDYQLKQATQYQQQAAENKVIGEKLKSDSENATVIFQQLYINEVIKSAENLVRLKDESHRIVYSKYKAGQVPIQEVEKSEIDKTQAESRLRNLKLKNIENQVQWKTLFGEEMQTQVWPFDINNKLKISTSEKSESSIRVNPSLAHLSNLVLAAESYWKSSRSEFWPQVDLGVEYLVQLKPGFESRAWQGGLTLTIPLWSRYEVAAQTSSRYAEYFSAKKQWESAENANKIQREKLAEKIELTRKNLEVAQENLKKSEKLYDDMLKSFRFGRLSTNELLIEQGRLISVQEGFSQSQWDYHKVLLESCNVLGEEIEFCIDKNE